MDFIDYREKLGIGFCDEEKFTYFLKRLFNRLEKPTKVPMDIRLIPPNDYLNFCELVGISIDYFILEANPIHDQKRFQCCLSVLREHSANLLDFLSYFVSFINSIGIRPKITSTYNRKHYADILINSLDAAHIQYELLMDSDEYFIYPKGIPEFDKALVSQPLEWLKSYPAAHVAWIKALKEYASATDGNASDVADKFRKSLETFFQEFFGGGRSLEKYVSDHTYEQYLDKCGVPSDIRIEFKNTVDAYAKFINNNAKHHDKTELNILEYLMYQTGNIIRLLITLKQEEQADAD